MPLIGLTPATADRLKQLLGSDTTPPPPSRRRPRGGGGGGSLKGKLDGALSFGGSATVSVWAFNGTAEADTGENVTAYDWLLSSGQTVAAGKQVWCNFDPRSNRWYVVGAQCS